MQLCSPGFLPMNIINLCVLCTIKFKKPSTETLVQRPAEAILLLNIKTAEVNSFELTDAQAADMLCSW